MSFRTCRHEDPFTRRVRVLYRANVVAAPRTGIEPFGVLAVHKRRVQDRGALRFFLVAPEDLVLPPVDNHVVTGLNGTWSVGLDAVGGVALTSTFLQALGIPVPGGEFEAILWRGASSIDFEVRDVRQHQVDVGALGLAVTGLQMNRAQRAAAVFFDALPDRMVIITRTLTSSGFAVRCSGSDAQSLKASVDAISDLVGKANVGVSWHRDSSEVVSFSGPTPVTFAFGAIGCAIQPNGALLFGRDADGLTLGGADGPPPACPIVEDNGLLAFDD
jgi:hypothetical protein